MASAFPRNIDELSKEWLSESFGAEVTSYEVSFLEGGVLADAYKLHNIQYSSAKAEAPASVVIKLANAVDERRAYAISNNAYVKEVKFFTDLADDIPLRTPIVYAIGDDGSRDAEFFVIMMEDLTAHSRVFDQVLDSPNEAFTRKINLEAAAMHAKFWESETLQLDWIGDAQGRYIFPLDSSCRECPNNVDTYVSLWEKMFGASPFDAVGASSSKELTDLVAGPKCIAILDYMNEVMSSRPQTLLHGDLRADNIFRTDPDLGKTVDESTITYIDWQLVCAGPPGPEFAQAWQHSLPPELRRKDRDFLKQYHDTLVQLQPAAAAYTYEMLIEDYKMSFVIWWMALITLGAATIPVFDQPEGERMKALWGQGLPYMLIAMEDHDCLDMIKRIAAEVG
ncbi:MAG: DUF1679 domain-containing protein [Proteobacteria bacterium]|nr:DUF1679 domain-containing protein [Pseudomonadota bacterium]